MKFLQFEKDGVKQPGILNREETCVTAVSDILEGRAFESLLELIQQISEEELAALEKAVRSTGGERGDAGGSDCVKAEIPMVSLNDVRILAPIERPIHDVLCVGVNYRDHLEESKTSSVSMKEDPKKPVYFGKRALRILGSGETIEARLDIDDSLDYEAELAVIIGKTGKDIPKEKAEDYIFGYSVFNDISSRQLQQGHVQWYRGKSLDTYTAMGPVILYKGALPFPVEVDVRSEVNGEVRQQSNTRLFLTDIPSVIAELSSGMTLEPGDIIATGTPAGVGMGFKPPRYMKKGDRVVCEIPQIGRLVNVVK